MTRGFLISETGGGPAGRTVVDDSLIIGRGADCGLVLDDAAASRNHVEIRDENGVFRWRDLGSTNGTLLNGVQMLEGELKHGDRLQIGETLLRFETENASGQASAADSTMFVGTMLDQEGRATPLPARGKPEELLHAVYKVMNEIASNYEPCSLLDRILETTMKAIQGQRGAVFFARSANEDLKSCPVCGNVHVIENGVLRKAEEGEIRISRTVAQRVLERGESVLYQDTSSEEELSVAESVVALNLRSIICVPIRGKFGALGILYIDSDRPSHQYTQDDMLLSTAVGNSAGLAIENANMHQQMLDKQRMEQEIAFAWTIQQGFLVREWCETEDRFQVYGETLPARTVGGDFYDFICAEDRRAGILIGDVSGKGVPASLTMAQLLAQFRVHARDLESPADVLAMLNADFALRSQRGAFCTMCYLTIDLDTGRLRCANAGHHPAIRLTGPRTSLFAEASGPPIGILPSASWTDAESTVDPGEMVLLYTDGIVEARGAPETSPGGREIPEYGVERLCGAIEKRCDERPRDIIAAVNDEVRRFCAPLEPHDDRTMIALRYLR